MNQPTILTGDTTRPIGLRNAVRRRSGLWAAIAAAVLALPALVPLMHAGFFVSDDGLFHVYRIAALADAWRAGVLYPRLFPEFGFGYGQAVFNYYAPLAYAPGALLALVGVSPATAAQITIALGLVLASLAAFGFARTLWGPAAGLAAAAAYTYFPYHLADAYVRGALPEFFAFVWPPLILWAYAAAFRAAPVEAGAAATDSQAVEAGRGRAQRSAPLAPSLLWGALAWAGLVYTHNLTALMLAPFFAAYLLVLSAWTGRWRRLLPAAGSLLLALALSAPLWLPFLVESRAVGIALGPSAGYQKHLTPLGQLVQGLLLYRYRGKPGGVADYPLSWLAPGLLALAALLAGGWLLRRRRIPSGPLLAFGLLLALVSTWLITASSLPAWRALQPVLAQLQYPWRFLALAAAGWLLVAGALPVLAPPRSAGIVAGLVIAACVVVALPNLHVKPLDISAAETWTPDRMWAEDAANGQVGATWTGEFLPLTVTEQRWALGRPFDGAKDGPAATITPQVRIEKIGYQQLALAIESAGPMPLRLHQFYLPGWTATLDGRAIPVAATGELGLVSVDVPEGSRHLRLRFGPTPARAEGAALAALATLVWAGWAWRSRRSHPENRATLALVPAAAVLLLLALVLGLNRFGVGQRSWTPRPSGARLGDVAVLLGSDLAPARGQQAVDVTLYWLALRDVATNYKTFVHLLGPDGQVLTQHDKDPGGGYSPTTRWRSGEVIADRHRLVLPAGLSPGGYGLRAGMYGPAPGGTQGVRNLPPDPPTSDGRVDLGSVQLPLTEPAR